MNPRDVSCCFTGHRKLPVGSGDSIYHNLARVCAELYHRDGIRRFLSGGALGFDTLAAEVILRARRAAPDIELFMILPFPGYDARWSYDQARHAREIIASADRVIYTGEYTRGISGFYSLYYSRDRYLVDNSRVCVAYQTEITGGTAYTVNYALEQGVRLINLAHPNPSAADSR